METKKEFDRQVLKQLSPPTIFIHGDMDILHTRGYVNRYLKPAPGRASLGYSVIPLKSVRGRISARARSSAG